MAIIAFLFGTSSILVSIFTCIPISKNWNSHEEGHCINVVDFYYANGVIMVGTDIILYLMPVIFTWNLEVRLPQRIALLSVFSLGAV